MRVKGKGSHICQDAWDGGAGVFDAKTNGLVTRVAKNITKVLSYQKREMQGP